MNTNILAVLNKYICEADSADDREQLKSINKHYKKLISQWDSQQDTETMTLINNVFSLMSRLAAQKEKISELTEKRSSLSQQEKEENLKVQRLIDRNLFTYHFQPIVRADNGEIYSYEALMRAGDIEGITPYHILKYAELSDRLDEIEKYTFLNVLYFIEKNKELFADRPVFINSMPNVSIDDESTAEIERLFTLLSDRVVVEMTENSQYKDDELNNIKGRYRRLRVPIAIDDYGTGYSNISNLLRYTPNYVKIDRSLLSGIQNSPNKKHFVREIIDFCHDNGILALAEGVESSEELRTVILLGADLIQGYYTARPCAEIISSLPYDIKAEIAADYQEREDGRRMKIYTAENGERINLERLSKEGYSCIRIGTDCGPLGVTVSGSKYMETGIHIQVAENFGGRITLDNARLENLVERPCIDIGENSDVMLMLEGSSKLFNSGIRVPGSSRLDISGKGNLDISLGNSDHYGIGNDLDSPHGDLIFDQDGTVSISADSHAGVLIGSGLGGRISIRRGRYVLNANGSLNVCVGSYSGDTVIDMLGCDFEGRATGAMSAVIGSVDGGAEIHAMYSSIRCSSASQMTVSLGSLNGSSAKVHCESVNIEVETCADALTAFGALNAGSDIRVERSSVKVAAEGAKALLFGGLLGGVELTLTDLDISAVISTRLDRFVMAEQEHIHTTGGRYRIKLNDTEYTRV